MKKLIAILLVALVGSVCANAKVVRSRTIGEKEKTPTEWIFRLGASINNAAGSGVNSIKEEQTDGENGSASVGSRVGMDFSVAFNKPIGKSGGYWGMELGIGSRGASLSSTETNTYTYRGDVTTQTNEYNGHIATWNGKFSPFTIGYKYGINSDIKLDGHIGAFVSYDFAGSAVSDETFIENGEVISSDNDKFNLGDDDLKDFERFDAGMQIGIGVWYHKFNFDITYQRGFINSCDYYYDDGESHSIFSSNLILRVGYSF
jgi:hypothetical protein